MANPVRIDNVKKVLEAIQRLAFAHVLVGVPQETGARKGEPLSNAALGYIHENGAPEANIPARPFLVPGVQDAQKAVVNAFRSTAKKAITADKNALGGVAQGMERAGQLAVNAVRRKINTGPFEPLSPNTLRKRDRKLLKKVRSGKIFQEQADKKLAARKPLIDTGQLRNAITYVVSGKL